MRQSEREQHASHHAQDGNHPVDTAGAVEIAGRSSRIGKADQALGNPRRDAGMTRYAKRHDRQQRSEHPGEQNQRKQAAST